LHTLHDVAILTRFTSLAVNTFLLLTCPERTLLGSDSRMTGHERALCSIRVGTKGNLYRD
jgi:hypothetical protein